jgi:hypothetical protein
MTAISNRLNFWRRSARLATISMIFTTAVFVAGAQTPDVLLQYSTLTGSGDTITAAWVPVVTDKGTTYKNITLLFEVSSEGVLTLAPGYPKVVASPTNLVSSFKAGKYVGPSTILGGEAKITVSGPGVTAGGATEWTLAATAGANGCTYPSTATWYVGPIASSPLEARLKKAGITSTAWYYGVIGVGNCNNNWVADNLIGLSQVGNTITIVSFTYDGSEDHPEPLDQITYTVAP